MTSLPAGVTVRPMTPTEFEAWRAGAVAAYAADVENALGLSTAAATERARTQFAGFLPQGRDTPGTWLLHVLDGAGAVAGMLWIGPHPDRPDAAWVYNIEIDEPRRGEGLGRAAMVAAEQVVRAAGIDEIGLNVFGFNDRARALYDSLGYRVVSTTMAKRLPAESQPAPGAGTPGSASRK